MGASDPPCKLHTSWSLMGRCGNLCWPMYHDVNNNIRADASQFKPTLGQCIAQWASCSLPALLSRYQLQQLAATQTVVACFCRSGTASWALQGHNGNTGVSSAQDDCKRVAQQHQQQLLSLSPCVHHRTLCYCSPLLSSASSRLFHGHVTNSTAPCPLHAAGRSTCALMHTACHVTE
jgi:hypothetical protein